VSTPPTPRPAIRILGTGGTIAGRAKSEVDARYKSAQVMIDVLLESVPEVDRLAVVSGEQLAQVASQDITDAHWLGLSRRIDDLLLGGGADGIVVTHGTDTMEETAYFLNLALRTDKPVVLTGSMRPSTAISADGPLNLYNAIAVATNPDARDRGVLVVIDDEVHAARDVTKTNTTDTDTFASPTAGKLGIVSFGKARFFRRPDRAHTLASEFEVDHLESLPRVEIIYAHAHMLPDLAKAAVAAGAKGVVVAGVGNGNLATCVTEALAEAARAGVVVVRSSRVGSGVVGRNHEVDDDRCGFVAADDHNPAKARVLLQLALTRTSDPAEIQRMFLAY
jgi:L-asparaginase